MSIAAVHLLLVGCSLGGTNPTEAISRSHTVLNTRFIPAESGSRASTILNERFPLSGEASSRATTTLNYLHPRAGEALGRAETILNQQHPRAQEAISRANTVCDVGDLNSDGQLTVADIGPFVDTLLDVGSNLSLTWASDAGCDLETDALDIQSFVNMLLEQP